MDHPRSRGVYSDWKCAVITLDGSSPLARGLRPDHSQAGVRGGIIPARAGFTNQCQDPGRAPQDHPRSRGVYHSPEGVHHAHAGSSPLARGLPPRAPTSAAPSRIIPARAGFTGEEEHVRVDIEDHPRSRGVYPVDDPGDFGLDGSSPLARGLPQDERVSMMNAWIIPARAGFTEWCFA